MKRRTGSWRPGANRSCQQGFTLLEALVVVAIVVVLAAIGIPALQLMLARSKLSGSAREIAVHLGSSRVTAMRMGRNVVVRPRFESGTLQSFVDDDEDFVFDPGEDEISSLPMPGSGGNLGVFMMGPDGVQGTATAPAQSIDGLTPVPGDAVPVAVFQPDGSIRNAGGLRLSDGKNPANVFEVRVSPSATARVEVLKFVYGELTGINPSATPLGSWFPQGGNAWEWY